MIVLLEYNDTLQFHKQSTAINSMGPGPANWLWNNVDVIIITNRVLYKMHLSSYLWWACLLGEGSLYCVQCVGGILLSLAYT